MESKSACKPHQLHSEARLRGEKKGDQGLLQKPSLFLYPPFALILVPLFLRTLLFRPLLLLFQSLCLVSFSSIHKFLCVCRVFLSRMWEEARPPRTHITPSLSSPKPGKQDLEGMLSLGHHVVAQPMHRLPLVASLPASASGACSEWMHRRREKPLPWSSP